MPLMAGEAVCGNFTVSRSCFYGTCSDDEADFVAKQGALLSLRKQVSYSRCSKQ